MISKILFTALVILATLIFIRHKSSRGRQQELASQVSQAVDRRRAMMVAIALVLLTLAISGAIFYVHWQESHRLFSVKVINSHSGAVQTYHVYQGDISGRSFRTIDGRLINLSDAERMEVQEGTGDSRE